MKNKKYYVYKFLGENDEVLYVGQTMNLKHRMYEHFIAHNKEFIKETRKIEYKEYDYKNEMNIYEIYYINKLIPKYNDVFNYNEPIDCIKEDTKEWIDFDFSYLLELKKDKVKNIKNDLSNNIEKNYEKLPRALFTDSRFKNFRGIDFLLTSIFFLNRKRGWLERKDIIDIIGKLISKNTLSSSLNLLVDEKIILINKRRELNKSQNYQYKFNLGKINKNNSFTIDIKAINYSLDRKISLSDLKSYLFIARENENMHYKYNDIIRVMGSLCSFPTNVKNLENIGLINIIKEKNEKGHVKNIYNL